MKRIQIIVAAAILALLTTPATVAQSAAFTYQGRLDAGGKPAQGRYDLIFQIFDAASGGNSIGGSITINGVAVSNGLFTVTVDFGSTPFTGPARWLQIQVSTNGAGALSAEVN